MNQEGENPDHVGINVRPDASEVVGEPGSLHGDSSFLSSSGSKESAEAAQGNDFAVHGAVMTAFLHKARQCLCK